MTVKLAGVDVADVKVGGAQAQRVMIGTGTTAVEAWSAAVYPVSGTWGPINTSPIVTVASHTIVEPGTYTLTVSSGPTVVLQLSINGGGAGSSFATFTATAPLPVGTVVSFQAVAPGTNSGTWSITKT